MNINKNEVLRYLGYKNQIIDENLDSIIDDCIEEIKKIAKPLINYKIVNIEVLNEEIKIVDYNMVLKGKNIFNHLKNSTKCAVMAVTLGVAVDSKIRRLNKIDATRAVIMDSCASEAVESLCEIAENEIKKIAENYEMKINYRYSPGYGDFSLSIQPEILKMLNAERIIGLTCTEDYILIPRKSVTAIIGFINKNDKVYKKSCKECNLYNSCAYRKDGKNCEF